MVRIGAMLDHQFFDISKTVDVETKTIEIEVSVDADIKDEEVGIKIPTIDVDKPVEDSPDNDPN